MVFNTLILFLLIFCFPLAGILNSAYVAVLLAAGKIVLQNRMSSLQCMASNVYIRNLLILTIGVIVLCACWTIGFGIYDFSLTAAYLSLFIGIIFSVLVFASLSDDLIDQDTIERLLVNVFFIQGLISIMAFTVPPFREFVHHFQFASDVELAEESYAGMRGLAISGRLYFEFAATCAVVTFIQFKRIAKYANAPYIELIKLMVIILCGFFAGRTSLVGIGFGLLYLLLCQHPWKAKFKILFKLATIIIASLLLSLLFLPEEIWAFFSERLLPWVFDLFIKYFETGSVENSYSFNAINEFYRYVDITPQEWWIGAGQYSTYGGGYYKQVDAGYLRQILYWGVIGSIISTLYSVVYFVKPLRYAKDFDNKLCICMIFLMTMIFQYKGDLASISRFYHVVILLLFLPLTLPNNPSTRLALHEL